MMTLRRLATALPLILAAALPAKARELSLAEINDYLNSFSTATATFTQANGDGSSQTGVFSLKRPGRMRFDYDPPEEAMVIVGGGQVAIFDPRSNDEPTRFPLAQTPLKIILARDIDLGTSGMIVDLRANGAMTSVTAADPDHPDYGSIRLDFAADPVRLAQWVITDGSGAQTVMVLSDLQTGVRLGDILFNILYEMKNWPYAAN